MLSENAGSGIAFFRKLSIDFSRAARCGKHCKATVHNISNNYMPPTKPT